MKEEEIKIKIKKLNLVLIFIKDGKCFGTEESGRVVFAKMKCKQNPDHESHENINDLYKNINFKSLSINDLITKNKKTYVNMNYDDVAKATPINSIKKLMNLLRQ